jgi:hypothetical protein
MSKSQKTTLEVKLADADSESLGTLPIRIEASDFAISIYPQGYGDFGSADGHGCPLFLEYYQGRLRVIAFPDINVEDPKIIDLSGAREDRRRDANDLQDETPLQKGRRFHEFVAQINPATGKKFTIKEAAAALDVDYATFRNLEALWRCPEGIHLKLEGRAN